MPNDVSAIHDLNVAAFGQSAEADLVDSLRRSGSLKYSLVAVDGQEIVGHLAISPITITEADKVVPALGLGPMAVIPSRQRQGIGTKLVNFWLEQLAEEKDNLVVLVGHPAYYPRFGFRPAKSFGIRWDHVVPDEAFMVLELRRGALNEISGLVRFHPAFNEVE
jgi:putative acetyltransferase